MVSVALPLVGYLDGACPQQNRQHQLEHLALPAVANAAEVVFQALTGDLCPVGMLSCKIAKYLLSNLRCRVRHETSAFFGYKAKAGLALVHYLGQRVKV